MPVRLGGAVKDGFSALGTKQLRDLRRNLLRGLDRVADHLDAGTFHQVGPNGEAPPSESGHLTLLLLRKVDAELESRRAANFPERREYLGQENRCAAGGSGRTLNPTATTGKGAS